MAQDAIARAVLEALGGKNNILTNTVCMTRLRVTLANPSGVDFEGLNDVECVLGTATRGSNGLEVVFGPRIIDGIYHAFLGLTGIEAGTDALFPMSRQESNMRVQISHGRAPSADASPAAALPAPKPAPATPTTTSEAPQMDEQDLSMLESFLSQNVSGAAEKVGLATAQPKVGAAGAPESGTTSGASAAPEDAPRRALLVINGPNLNMLGIREPGLYGRQDYPTMLALCKDAAREAGFTRCDCYQSNHEGDLVDVVQDAYGAYDGIVINPGAYTHTSIALLDALKAVNIPAVEVHISAVDEREDFRQVSYVRLACFETIMGLGIEGYRKAIFDLAHHLDASAS